MAKTVADQFAETLAAAGVKRIYGIVGDSLNGLTDALRRQGKIEWVHVRHEEVAAFAAGAEAHLTGELAVCAGSCGPGNLHLINGLFDCHRSRVPVLGGLFGNQDLKNNRTELVLFITPQVLESESDYQRVIEDLRRKMEQIEDVFPRPKVAPEAPVTPENVSK